MSGNKPTLGKELDRMYQVLKSRKRLEWFLFLCVAAIVFFFFAVSEKSETSALFGILMCCFAALQYKASNREALLFDVLGENADLRDKLCIANHEVERLTLELETIQSVLLEAKNQKNITQQKAGPVSEKESEGDPSIKKFIQKPSRKPAPKRKLKTESVNENKN